MDRNQIAVEDIHKFIRGNYIHSVEVAIMAMIPVFSLVIVLTEGFTPNSHKIAFFICAIFIALGVIGNILYYRSALKDKKRISQLISLNFPNYHKDYHDFLLKAYEEVRNKELGKADNENEVILIKDVFNKKLSDYEKLVSDALKAETIEN